MVTLCGDKKRSDEGLLRTVKKVLDFSAEKLGEGERLEIRTEDDERIICVITWIQGPSPTNLTLVHAEREHQNPAVVELIEFHYYPSGGRSDSYVVIRPAPKP